MSEAICVNPEFRRRSSGLRSALDSTRFLCSNDSIPCGIGAFPVNLHAMLLEREAASRPVTVGLIGAGKFGTMFLAQARLTRGMHIVAVADLDAARARNQLRTASWYDDIISASSLAAALTTGRTFVTDDAFAVIAFPEI